MRVLRLKHLSTARVMLAVAALYSLNTVSAQDFQDTAAIKETVRDYVLKQIDASPDNINITIGTIDPRLHLASCNGSLEAYQSTGGRMLGNTSIGVRCNAGTRWKLYVPVSISVYDNVLIAKRYLRRGTLIQASDLEQQPRDLATLNRGYVTQPQQAVGMILKQPVRAETAINPAMLEAQKLVRRGESVIILAKNEGLEVRMKGKALNDGVNGEIIQVQNLASQRIVEGQVVSRGVISVPM
jgi:flagellar basal body P-ring formation protein FlgA